MQRMRRRVAAEVGRLLRVLLLRVGALPADAERRVLFVCFAAIGRRGNVGVKTPRNANRRGGAGRGVVAAFPVALPQSPSAAISSGRRPPAFGGFLFASLRLRRRRDDVVELTNPLNCLGQGA